MKVQFYRQRDAFPHTRKEQYTPDEIEIMVMLDGSDSDEGLSYEFKVAHIGTEPKYRKPIGLQIQIFDDGWRAFQDLPEFFEALRANDREYRDEEHLDLDGLTQILLDLGYEDITERYSQRVVHVQGCLTCSEVHA